jgi:hypothetical protein
MSNKTPQGTPPPAELPEALQAPDPESPAGKLFEAARQQFIEAGFEGSPTRAIAERAGMNAALIHYYFGTKEKLYLRVLAAGDDGCDPFPGGGPFRCAAGGGPAGGFSRPDARVVRAAPRHRPPAASRGGSGSHRTCAASSGCWGRWGRWGMRCPAGTAGQGRHGGGAPA